MSYTGTVAVTDGADVGNPILGEYVLNTVPSVGYTGTVTSSGSVAVTEGTDLISASGWLSGTGTVNANDSTDLTSLTGQIIVSGSVNVTDGADTTVESGGETVSGSVAYLETTDLITATGGETISGSLAFTDYADFIYTSSKGAGRNHRKYFKVKKDGKVYLFESKAQADAYFKAQEAERVSVPVAPVKEVREFAEQRGELKEVNQALRRSDYEAVIRLYNQYLQEEQQKLIAQQQAELSYIHALHEALRADDEEVAILLMAA